MKAICIKTTQYDGILYESLLNIYEVENYNWPHGLTPNGEYEWKITHNLGRVHVMSRKFFEEHFKVLDSGEGRG